MTANTRPQRTDIGNALRGALISPNESDRNLEPANVVDGLFAIARAIDSLATAVTRVAYGGITGPTGLEMLSMAMTGEGAAGHDSVTTAIRDGFHELAEVMAEAIPAAAEDQL